MKHVFRTLAAVLLGAAAWNGLFHASALAEPLQTQMGVNGLLEADVVKAQVQGNVLTVAILFRNTSSRNVRLERSPSEFFYVDAAGRNKYMVLRDAKGQWLAGPLNAFNKALLRQEVAPKGRAMIWLKFPAPPADSATIDLTTPFTLPFDHLPVQR